MSASYNCLTCNANWDTVIDDTSGFAVKISKESRDNLFNNCVPMVKDLETLGKGYIVMSVAKQLLDDG